jgi:hypothetical protein
MDLFLIPEQLSHYEKLRAFLGRELPTFVNKYSTVREALIKYGKVGELTSRNLVVTALSRALEWGTPPKVMVMARDMFVGGSDDWYGTYDPKKKMIVLSKSLVTQWQKTPDDKVLRRAMITVMLHELVHFLNHEVRPGTTIHSERGHLKGTFQREAFEKPPLSWEPTHHMMYREVLRSKGVE